MKRREKKRQEGRAEGRALEPLVERHFAGHRQRAIPQLSQWVADPLEQVVVQVVLEDAEIGEA